MNIDIDCKPGKNFKCRRKNKLSVYLMLISFVIILAFFFNFRFDWTKDKRYTLHPASKALLKTLEHPIEVEIYLAGHLNPGFTRLQESTVHLLNDMYQFSSQKITYRITDPYRQGREFTDYLNTNQMAGVSVNERSGNGQWTQHIVYPYALVHSGDRQVPVALLVNRPGYSGEDNLNLSCELLEYRLAHAVQLATQKTSRRIVFLEGHDELPEETISEITDRLSYEYTIDRGVLSGRPDELNGYDLVIVAGPQTPFPEADKYVLDQYLMQGGSVLWLVNGVRLRSYDELVRDGKTLGIAEDLNLNDLFFTYGCRINPVVLQDEQCLSIPVARTDTAGQTEYVSTPWYYAPLLTPSHRSEITKGMSWIKTGFASTVSFVGEDTTVRKEVLLASSAYARAIPVPAWISLEEIYPDKKVFNEAHLPVGVLLQGVFPSVFKNRPGFSAQASGNFLSESRSAKMIVIASEDLIRNPLGYDSYSRMQFSNAEFILNAVNFLTDDTGLSALRNRSLQMQLLNKPALQRDRNRIIGINVVLPPLLLLGMFVTLSLIRKRKYTKEI